MLRAVTTFVLENFQKEVSMLFYAIEMSFQRVEDAHSGAVTITLCRYENLLPDRKKLGDVLLQKCNDDVKHVVHIRLKGLEACIIRWM